MNDFKPTANSLQPDQVASQRKELAALNDTDLRALIDQLKASIDPIALFRDALARILRETAIQNNRLNPIRQSDVTELAWAARNVLELRIWTRYIFQSSENVTRFRQDELIDGAETLEALIVFDKEVLAKEHDGLLQVTEENVERLNGLRKVIREQGVEGKKHLSTGALSGSLGLGREFVAFNRLTSKLVHPSALSMYATDLVEVHTRMFVGWGLISVRKLIADTRTHISTFGVAPKTANDP